MSNIHINEELNRIIIGDTAIALYGEVDGELEMVDTHKGASWVEFGGENTRVSVEFEKLHVESQEP